MQLRDADGVRRALHAVAHACRRGPRPEHERAEAHDDLGHQTSRRKPGLLVDVGGHQDVAGQVAHRQAGPTSADGHRQHRARQREERDPGQIEQVEDRGEGGCHRSAEGRARRRRNISTQPISAPASDRAAKRISSGWLVSSRSDRSMMWRPQKKS